MARPDEAALFARESAADATLRTARASAAQDALELDADERRRAAEDAADERRRREMGLQGVLPVERRRAAPGVDLQAFGLISVARIFVRSAYSLSAFAQRSPSSTRNASSAVSCFFVIPSSCFECASSSFAVDSAAVLSITSLLPNLVGWQAENFEHF